MIYTSDSLRALATIMDISWLMVRHADAWEAEVAALRERLERAERLNKTYRESRWAEGSQPEVTP